MVGELVGVAVLVLVGVLVGVLVAQPDTRAVTALEVTELELVALTTEMLVMVLEAVQLTGPHQVIEPVRS